MCFCLFIVDQQFCTPICISKRKADDSDISPTIGMYISLFNNCTQLGAV